MRRRRVAARGRRAAAACSPRPWLDRYAGVRPPPRPAAPRADFRIDDARITESSGLALSRAHPHTVWTVNDSGDSARVFAVDTRTGRTVGVHTFDAPVRDVEALAITPQGRMLVADIGDNDRVARRRQGLLVRRAGPGQDLGRLGVVGAVLSRRAARRRVDRRRPALRSGPHRHQGSDGPGLRPAAEPSRRASTGSPGWPAPRPRHGRGVPRRRLRPRRPHLHLARAARPHDVASTVRRGAARCSRRARPSPSRRDDGPARRQRGRRSRLQHHRPRRTGSTATPATPGPRPTATAPSPTGPGHAEHEHRHRRLGAAARRRGAGQLAPGSAGRPCWCPSPWPPARPRCWRR